MGCVFSNRDETEKVKMAVSSFIDNLPINLESIPGEGKYILFSPQSKTYKRTNLK